MELIRLRRAGAVLRKASGAEYSMLDAVIGDAGLTDHTGNLRSNSLCVPIQNHAPLRS
jgi:hypothetical protein